MDKTALLDRIRAEGEDRLLLARVLDRAEQASRRGTLTATDFLSPQQQMMAADALRLGGLPEEGYGFYGGYDGAERRLILFLPDWLDKESAETEAPVRVLRAAYREEFKLTHRDLLGSLMGLGVVREKLGDILVTAESADVVAAESVADFLRSNWVSAGRAKLDVTEVESRNIHIPVQRCEEIRDTVSSLRLDAVCSTGFRMARGRAAELIASGRVQLNWRETTKGDRILSEGDTVSARGFGKFVLAEVGGLTKKGRISIMVRRYL